MSEHRKAVKAVLARVILALFGLGVVSVIGVAVWIALGKAPTTPSWAWVQGAAISLAFVGGLFGLAWVLGWAERNA